jgi:diaminopimelate epimerase
MRLVKGHGTENDFLVLPDLDGAVDLTPAMVRALCDRRAGLGADGVLRVVRSAEAPEAKELADRCEFFMDYRNADGSLAEMCGNGMRVFFRYLQRHSLVGQDAAVATRGGIVRVWSQADQSDGDVTLALRPPRILADRPVATAAPPSGLPPTAGLALEIPNPHVVVPVPDRDTLLGLDLTRPPVVAPALPTGQNVEFVVRTGERALVMRVHERGVGETRSCGTGICAAAVAVAHTDGVGADESVWTVDVPGGRCQVIWRRDAVELSGPAVLLADIDVDLDWLRSVTGGSRLAG